MYRCVKLPRHGNKLESRKRKILNKNISFSTLPHQNKDKEEGEKEDDKQGKTGVKRGRPPMRTTPPSAGRSVSKTPSNEGRSNSKSSRLSDTSSLPNGEGESGRTLVM